MNSAKLATMAAVESNISQLTADEYSGEILEHMIRMDRETRPDPSMIDQQPEISWHWWPVLINMMVDMHAKLGLEPQTLFLAVSIVNRYCARRIVYQKHFRLVGVTAMWIASKYEDKKTVVPTLRLLRHMANGNYSEDMFVMMEGHILNTLEWTVTHCGVDSFLRVLLSENQAACSPMLMQLTSYIAEITLYHKVFVGSDTLQVARAINALALHLLNMSQSFSFEEPEQWQHWVPTLADIILQPPQAIAEKYRAPERLAVTRVVDSWVLRRQRQAQEEAAAAQAAAEAAARSSIVSTASPGGSPVTPNDVKHGLRVNVLSRQSSSASLPMTPPPSATRFNQSQGQVFKSNPYGAPYSEFTPPNIGGFHDAQDIYGAGSPLAMHSLASLASYGSVTSLNSVSSGMPYGMLDSHSPPTTPGSLNPPKPSFRV